MIAICRFNLNTILRHTSMLMVVFIPVVVINLFFIFEMISPPL